MSLWGPQIHYVPLGSPRATCQNLNRRCGSIIAPRVWGLSSLNYKLWVPLSAPLSIQHVRPLGPGSWRASKRLSEKSRLIGRNLLPAKTTASGRVTLRASSDPACLSHSRQGLGRLSHDSG